MNVDRTRTSQPRRSRGLLLIAVGVLAGLAVTLAPTPASAVDTASAEDAGQYFVPDVEEAFRSISRRPDGMAITRTFSRAGTVCKHYQGLVRVHDDDGTPYMIMTKSGNAICPGFEDDEPGWLVVAELGTRPKHRERLRTNVLPFGVPYQDLPELANDKVVAARQFDGDDLPAYGHPGGMQVVGDTLVVGADTPYEGERLSTIFFFDISDPTNPTLENRFPLPDAGELFTADPTGITAVKNDDGECCLYLLVAAGGEANEQVRFYRSAANTEKGTTDLLASPLEWEDMGRYSDETLDDCIGATWPTSGIVQGGQHQMLNFVREGDLDGPLYLVGGRRDGTILTPDELAGEYLDLYEMNVSPTGEPGACPFHHRDTRFLLREAWGNDGVVSSLSAASGVYVSPSGELTVYAGRHNAVDDDKFILFGEYRNHGVVREDSPTLHPTASLATPFAVDEGSSTNLTGTGEQAITKAFIELFEDDDAGANVPSWYDADEWLIVDYEDRDAANFDDLGNLGGLAAEMDENAGSWRWFAPVGCTISANDGGIADWPGEDTILLRSDVGEFRRANNLDAVSAYHPSAVAPWALSPSPNPAHTLDYDDDVGGITFYHPQMLENDVVARVQGCQSYYNAPIGIGWDLNNSGDYEATGTSVPFDAALLDGPTAVDVAARAQHPTDPSDRGVGERLSAQVEVRNVAPVVESATVTDSLGNDLLGAGAFAVVGLPVSLDVTFTDPGVADTQEASVDWGDGSPVDTTFASYTDAEGGATGALHDTRVYASGGMRTITATITDDDGGATPVELTIEVLSLEDAIERVAEDLTDLIAATTDARVRTALLAARDELIGNHTGTPPTNGAVDKLDASDPVGAITKLRAAIGFLITAESRSAGALDLTSYKDLLGLVAEGIATAENEKAKTRVPAPSANQAKTFAAIATLITQGHQRLATGQYLTACDSFRQATEKALSLKK